MGGKTTSLLVVVVALLIALVRGQDLRAELDNIIQENTKICEGYLSTVGDAFDQGGVEGLTRAAYTLAVDNPLGPYIWCYKNIAKDVRPGEIVRLLSPYLPANTTLKDSTTIADPSKFLNKIKEVAQAAMDNCCGAPNYFNFSLPFNQNKSMGGSMYFDSEREFIGTSEKYPGSTDSYFFCGCPVTNIANTPRNNTYAELYLAGSPVAPVSPSPGTSASSFATLSSSVVLMVLVMLLV